jgi:hypothetical protein
MQRTRGLAACDVGRRFGSLAGCHATEFASIDIVPALVVDSGGRWWRSAQGDGALPVAGAARPVRPAFEAPNYTIGPVTNPFAANLC